MRSVPDIDEGGGAVRYSLIGVVALGGVVLLAGAQPGRAQDNGEDEVPFAEANLFFELNDTDGDLAIHALIDGDAYRRLEIEDPDERQILDVRAFGSLAQQGLTELFFESAEPSFDELTPEEFFERFPAGTYEIEAHTLEGPDLESEVQLTHVLPAPPENVEVAGQTAAEDCDATPLPSVPSGDVEISWDAVTESHPQIGEFDPSIDIVGYQVVAEREEPSLLIFSVDLPADTTTATIPASFIALGDEFEFEIVARAASGNQTAVESCFEVE
jgi:hypothetical protein